MKAVIQRVKKAEVKVKEKSLAKIKRGALVFLGVEKEDNKEEAEKLAKKILKLRIFPSLPPRLPGGRAGKASANKNIDRSVVDVQGEILVVSQFTLCADTSKGNRPSFVKAASPEKAEKIYNYFIDFLKQNSRLKIESGEFGAMMEVKLINDGPVTIVLEI